MIATPSLSYAQDTHAQETLSQDEVKTDDLARKPKSKVAPVYPDVARRMNIEGTVKLAVVVSPNGTVSKYAPNGTRYDCIEKCVGPACCVEVRALPNPARDVNSIGH